MARYVVEFTRSARRELESLSAELLGRIFPEIESLETSRVPPGAENSPVREIDGGFVWATTLSSMTSMMRRKKLM
jgi:hypothetical protein